jgi:heme oxygenase
MPPASDPSPGLSADGAGDRRHGSVRWILRDATAEEHARCERLVGPLDSPAAYHRFLAGKAIFCTAVLRAASQRLAAATLAELRGDLDRIAEDRAAMGSDGVLPVVPILRARSQAEAMGMVYVAEGARLGAAVLHRQATSALGVSAIEGARFLAGGGGSTRWTTFLDALDRAVATPEDVDDAVAGARAAFRVFGRALAPATA